MSNKLNNIKIGFGESKNSPMTLTNEQLKTLMQVIEDETVETKQFSGFVSTESPLKGSQAYILGVNGITYVGKTEVDNYTISADKTEIKDGDNITISVEGVPTGAITFEVGDVTIISGDVTPEYVKALLSFDGNVLKVARGTNIDGWKATVAINSKPIYESPETQSINISVSGKTRPTSIEIVGRDALAFGNNIFTINRMPETTDIGIASLEVISAKEASDVTTGAFNINMAMLPETEESYDILVKAILEDGTILEATKTVTAIALPVDNASVTGDANITDYQNHNYVMAFGRKDGKVPNIGIMQVLGVTANVDWIEVSNVSVNAFTANVIGGYTRNESVEFSIAVQLESASRLTFTHTVKVTTEALRSVSIVGVDEIEDTGDTNFLLEYDPSDEYVESVKITAKEYDPWEDSMVDLGLPSGLLWCNRNIGAETETDYGRFFMWGDTEGEDMTDKSIPTRRYGFDLYDSMPYGRNKLETDIAPTSGFDAARANMGGTWRMPTKKEVEELVNNTDRVYTTINGVNGMKFTSKSDPSKYIFIPCAGEISDKNWSDKNNQGFCWSSSRANSVNAYMLYFTISEVRELYDFRCKASPIRAVCPKE